MIKKDYLSSNIGNYDLIETEDGSKTLFSNAYNEACHSLSGARAETYYNYFIMSGVKDNHVKNSPFNILEVGFGLGLGYLVTVEEIMKLNSSWQGTFYSLEIDPALVEYAKENQIFPENCPYPIYKDLKKVSYDEFDIYEATKNQVTLKVLIGDATKTLDMALANNVLNESSINSIFQDAFSPKRNPDLWTIEWFKLLAKLSKNQTIMSTYSASQGVRKRMEEAGFQVLNMPGFGPKRSMTQAIFKQD